MKKIFVVKQHPEFGNLGLIEKTAPKNFDPLTGMGTAHDCLEHFPGGDDSLKDEFMALGCTLWIRGTQDYFNSSPARNLSGEIGDMLFRFWHYDKMHLEPAKKDIEVIEDISKCLEMSKRNIFYDFQEGMEEDGISEDIVNQYMKSAAYWLQIGYNKAKKRYKKPWNAVCVFRDIEKQVDQLLESGDIFEGQEVEISYIISSCKVNVNPIYQWDE